MLKVLRSFYFLMALYAVGVIALCLLIAIAGPMLPLFGSYPLETNWLRYLLTTLVFAGGAGFAGYLFWKRKKAAEALEAGLAGPDAAESDQKVLAGRMKEALTTLKASGGDKADYLYDLPWYVIIGPPGSGKTTALVNSGLKFPLSKGATPAAVAGAGGTRYCDWWFTEEAVLIDTAGRYTTQDSNKSADSKSWLAFLDLLKSNRPHQPINGVIVAISLEEFLSGKQDDQRAHADAIRARLVELHDRLKVDFPVYALFTKGDLVAGFSEFFGSFNEPLRHQVWGATFKPVNKADNMIAAIPEEFDKLLHRLNDMTTDRLQEEPTPSTRVALFGFPAQMARLRRPLHDFLNRIFEPTRYHANAMLRGFYFASGTQQGTPIDQLIGSLAKNFGGKEVKAVQYSRLGKSYYLTNLLSKTIFGEANWVSSDPAAVRRERLMKLAGFGALAAVSAGAVTAWSVSYLRNRALIGAEDQAVASFMNEAGPIARQTKITDHDLKPVLPLLNRLQALPTGHAEKDVSATTTERFGLSQRERLSSVATNSYRIGLERLFRPRLIYRLEEFLEQNRNNPNEIYEPFKVYMMLTGTGSPRRDPGLVRQWFKQDWATLYPGAADAAGRAALERHIEAMLVLEDGHEPLVGANDSLVKEVQRSLARLNLSQRAYALLKSQSGTANAPDWSAVKACGEDINEVFTTAKGERGDAISVPGFFTYAGFHRAFLARLSGIQDRLAQDRWVLGAAGETGDMAAQFKSLPQDLRALYTREFHEAWGGMLGRMRLKSMVGDKPTYRTLGVAAASNAPIKCLLEQMRLETAVTRERPNMKPDDNAKKGGELVSDPNTPGVAVGSDIEAPFKPYYAMVEGDAMRRPIDAVVAGLADINQTLILAANPAQAQQANATLLVQVEALRRLAARLPQPFAGMLQTAAAEFDRDLTTGNLAQLRQALGDQVSGPCTQIIANRYPFDRSSRDVALQDFGRLFGAGGIIDTFFKTSLAPYVDMSQPVWAWRQTSDIGRALASSPDTLRPFQAAARIRETFLATGGQMPNLTLSITAPQVVVASPIPGQAPAPDFIVRLDANGTPVTSTTGPPTPAVVQWPGANSGRSAVTVSDGPQSAVFERTGPWSLFRLIEAGAPQYGGNLVQVSYVVGGKVLMYRIGASTATSPFNLATLREFQCPAGL